MSYEDSDDESRRARESFISSVNQHLMYQDSMLEKLEAFGKSLCDLGYDQASVTDACHALYQDIACFVGEGSQVMHWDRSEAKKFDETQSIKLLSMQDSLSDLFDRYSMNELTQDQRNLAFTLGFILEEHTAHICGVDYDS